MRAILRRSGVWLLFSMISISGFSVSSDVDVSEMLKNAVPREIIPELYRNERPITLNSDRNTARIQFNGPGMAHIEVSLGYFKESARSATMADTYLSYSYSGNRVVSRNLGIGEASFHVSNEWAPDRRHPEKVHVTSQTVKIFWEKFILGVKIVHYSRMNGTQDFSHEEAGKIIRKLAEGTYEKIHSKPGLKELTVKQRHIDYDTAKIRVQARASYTTIGNYDRHEITFFILMRGAQTVEKKYDAYAPQVRRSGNDLYLDVEFEHRKTGPYSVKVTLVDTRQDSVASEGEMQIDLQSSLRLDMNISRPKAKILSHQREVYIGRLEPTTVERGMSVNSRGRYIPSSTSTIFDDIAYIRGNIPDATYDSNTPRTGELLNDKTSRFLYEGDKIVLHAEKDYRGLSTRFNVSTFDEYIKRLEQEVCFVVLQWENGLKGKALFDPYRPNANLSGEFIVGTSRGASGKWKRTWGEWFGDTYNFLFDQATGKLKDKAVEWVLEKAEVTLPQMPAMPLVLVLFNLSAGDTVYDDLVYLNLKSKVYLTSYQGQLEVYTLQGSPEIINPQNGTRVKISPGQMITIKPGNVGQPQPFDVQTIGEKWIERRSRGKNTGQVDTQKDNFVKKDYDIPHLQADIEDFYFFEGGKKVASGLPAKTSNVFDSKSTRYVYWLLNIKYPVKAQDVNFNFSTVWDMPDGRELGRFDSTGVIKAGWGGSYYSSGWGDPNPGNWAPGIYTAKVYLDGKEVAKGSFTITDLKGQWENKVEKKQKEQKKPVYDFSMWPLEAQLNTAVHRISMKINNSSGRDRDVLENVRRLVTQAKQSYLRARGPDGGIFNGSVDPADCPYKMMKVIRECQQNLIQTQAGWERSPYSPQLTQEEISRSRQAMKKAVGDVDLAVMALETFRDWKHFTDSNGIRFQAPRSFNVFQTSDFPYAVRQVNAEGQLEKVVLVRKREKPQSMSDMTFQNELLDTFRKKFSDFKLVEEFRTFLGMSGHWSTYTYTWEGQSIKVLLYQNPYAAIPVEMRYVATTDTYDSEEAEEIIRTLK